MRLFQMLRTETSQSLWDEDHKPSKNFLKPPHSSEQSDLVSFPEQHSLANKITPTL